MGDLLRSAYQKAYSVLGNRGLTKIGFVRGINSFFVGKLQKKQEFVEVDGNKIYLLEKDSAISNSLPVLEKVEPMTTDLFGEIVNEGDVVLDLGANIGYYAVLFAKRVGKGGRVFAFEPDPRNLPVLRKNVEANGYKNVTVVEKAVSDRNGKLKLFLTGTSDSNSIYEFSKGLPSVEVETVSLDEFFREYGGKVDIVKMDIQGAEYAALMGMKELVKKNPQMRIVAEFEPKLMRDCGFDPEKYLRLLGEMGFEIRNINEKKRKIGVESVEELLKNYSEAGDNTNLYCVGKNPGSVGERK